MFTRILVPLDGSALAERALPYAERLASVGGATLVLVRSAVSQHHLGGDRDLEQRAAIDEAEAYVSSVAARLAEDGCTVQTAVPYGSPAYWMGEEVELRNADLVVMATHGRSGAGRMIYGSVAEQVLAHSKVPVVLVRAWQDTPLGLSERPRLVVPLDGSGFAETALPTAAALAAEMGGSLVLTLAVPIPTHVLTAADGHVVSYLDQQEQSFRREAGDYLHQVRTRLAPAYPGLPILVDVRLGPPAESILEAASESGAQLVVMATHGRTGLDRIVMGSVAGEVLRQGTLPLLLVRPPMLAAAPVVLRPATVQEPTPTLAAVTDSRTTPISPVAQA